MAGSGIEVAESGRQFHSSCESGIARGGKDIGHASGPSGPAGPKKPCGGMEHAFVPLAPSTVKVSQVGV